MIDGHDARLWAEDPKVFARHATELLDKMLAAFQVLNRIEYSAPWRKRESGRCGGVTLL